MPRTHLVDFLREDLGLTGSHLGCEHGVCGACTVRLDGEVVRGCLVLAVQADGATVETVEGLTDGGTMRDLQDAFVARNALQCGYCTPGMLMAAAELIEQRPDATRDRCASGSRATTVAAPVTRRSSTRSAPCWTCGAAGVRRPAAAPLPEPDDALHDDARRARRARPTSTRWADERPRPSSARAVARHRRSALHRHVGQPARRPTPRRGAGHLRRRHAVAAHGARRLLALAGRALPHHARSAATPRPRCPA